MCIRDRPRIFRCRAEHGPDGDVRHCLVYRCFDLRSRVCGITDDRTRSEQAPRSRWRKVLLPHVRSRGAGEERDVHAIVHDHVRAVRIGGKDQAFGVLEKWGRREMLCAQLDQARATVEKRSRQTRNFPASALGGIDIENGVQSNRTDVLRAYTASASGPDLGFARKRSMNAVPSRPATKSGSDKILR